MQNIIEQKLNNLVEYQFPEFFRTDGPVFVQFLKEYYKWLEGTSDKGIPITKSSVSVNAKSLIVTNTGAMSFYDYFTDNEKIAIYEEDGDYRIYDIYKVDSDNQLTLKSICDFTGKNLIVGTVVNKPNTIYHARRLFEYDDIDSTVEDFVLHFKKKYLQNIQFETLTNKRELVKHALDIYRAKGTERAADLLFRLVFGTGATFYYPSSDLFKLSDGVWTVPTYLELSLNEETSKFINKQIIGLTSGATAFAEALVRRTVKGKLLDVLYISSIKGNFQTNEIINTSDFLINNAECPIIIGSLSELLTDVTGTSEFYKIGDIVNVSSSSGEQAKARVTDVSDITGLANFNLKETGYAYTTLAEAIVSEKVLILNNVTANNTTEYFSLFETVSQPMCNISFVSANGVLTSGISIHTYHANNDLAGNGIILSVTSTNSTSGTILVSPVSGNLNFEKFYTSSNSVMANNISYANVTAIGNVINYSKNLTLSVSNTVGAFKINEQIYQLDNNSIEISSGTLTGYTTTVGANGIIKISNTQNVILSNNMIYGRQSNATAKVHDISFNLGIKDITNDFYAYDYNVISGNNLGTNATVTTLSSGAGASFQLANTLIYTEEIEFNIDAISNYTTVSLNAVDFGFPALLSSNLDTTINSALTTELKTIGRPTKLTNINKGSGYSIAPMTLIYEPLTFPFHIKDKLVLKLDSSPFYVGEMVTQQHSNSRGIIISANSMENTIVVSNLRFLPENMFEISSNSLSYLSGDKSGGLANVVSIIEYDKLPLTEYMGTDAIASSNVQASNGAVTGLKVIQSGVGFVNNEPVEFNKEGLAPGEAIAIVKTNGKSEGRYTQKGGFLSDQKKLYDGYYYQDFSYEIRSSVTLVKYEDMLKKLLHVSGTKYFGAFVKNIELISPISSIHSIITVS